MIIAAACAFGMETALSMELKRMNIAKKETRDGFITFEGDESLLARSIMSLRTADRLFVQAGRFSCGDFDDLYEGLRNIPWEKYCSKEAGIAVDITGKKSPLKSFRQAQRIGKKAVVDRLGSFYGLERMPETETAVHILVRFFGSDAIVLVDAAGHGLHKRGYALKRGAAPLRETLAAGMVLLSKWKGKEIILDPFCGSGTIAIEAALIASEKAPNVKKQFHAEQWPVSKKNIWDNMRNELAAQIKNPMFEIVARDIDGGMISAAKENASRAGVSDIVRFEKGDAAAMGLGQGTGLLIANPPYGERMGDADEISRLYSNLGRIYAESSNWDLTLLTSEERFEREFGRKSDRNRKIYNGKLKSYLYFYYGERR